MKRVLSPVWCSGIVPVFLGLAGGQYLYINAQYLYTQLHVGPNDGGSSSELSLMKNFKVGIMYHFFSFCLTSLRNLCQFEKSLN